jgi:hypothetical protein
MSISSEDQTIKHMCHVLDDVIFLGDGGAYRDRTDDLLNANQALSQLS